MRKFVCVASSVVSLLVFAGSSGSAVAADLDWRNDRSMRDEPVYVPRYGFSWTGFYLGGNLGYSWGTTSTTVDGAADGFTVDPSGWVGGAQIGYNWQVDNFVFGIEGDLGFLGAEDDQRSSTAFVDTEYGGYGTITGRLGLVDDRFLFYLKGGLALASIENRAGTFADPADLTDNEEIRAGWTLGVGAEYAFRPDWSMKIEYMYMDFGEDSSSNSNGDNFRHDNELHSIKVGLNYRLQQMQEPLR